MRTMNFRQWFTSFVINIFWQIKSIYPNSSGLKNLICVLSFILFECSGMFSHKRICVSFIIIILFYTFTKINKTKMHPKIIFESLSAWVFLNLAFVNRNRCLFVSYGLAWKELNKRNLLMDVDGLVTDIFLQKIIYK